MVCDMQISADGELITATLYDAVMRSRARLIYDDVAAMLRGEKKSQLALLPHLQALQSVYKQMLIKRQARGALDFESVETRIVFGKNQKIEAIIPVQRNEAHRIIEECMLMANVAAAQFLTRHKIPTLYRVHKGPNPEKMENLKTFLKGFGLNLSTQETPTPLDYQRVLKRLEKRPDAHLIQTVLLRSLMQAVYTPDNLGHFGLAYEAYVHFTSPIRRYPDLLVHRGIRLALQKEKKQKKHVFSYNHAQMASFGDHCSLTERRADDATRDAVNWLKCYYMQDKLGQTFEGIITGVTAFGIFVELSNIYVEGLVHISALRDDYYSHDAVQHLLRGKRTGITYRLGDSIRVLVARANLSERELEFELATASNKTAEPTSKKNKKTKQQKTAPAAKENKPLKKIKKRTPKK
jgi:ribonuclease R